MQPIRTGELHPLENPLIMDLVFQLLPVDDLKSCRQVSKSWYHHSLNAWRSSVYVYINNDSEGNAMSDFVNFVRNRNSSQLTTPFTTNYFIGRENYSRFWTLCGSTIKVLELQQIRFPSLSDLRNVIYRLCPNMEKLTLSSVKALGRRKRIKALCPFLSPQYGEHPKLKSLTVFHIYDGQFTDIPTWMELLSHFPSLENIFVRLTEPFVVYDQLFQSLIRIREGDPNKLQLKSLKVDIQALFDMKNPQSFYRALENSGLHLNSLFMHVPHQEDATELRKLLTAQASSLRKLILCRGFMARGRRLDPIDCFPTSAQGLLENLQELEVLYATISSLSFLKVTPNLRKLVVKEFSLLLSETLLADMMDVRLDKCKELSINNSRSLTGEEFSVMMDWFPNVETCMIDKINNEKFALICDRWPNLVSLKIFGSSIDDCGITGMDAIDVARLNYRLRSRAWRPITVRKPNITSLKYLQKFALWGGDHLGYCAAVCGIQEMSKLRHLSISDYFRYGTNLHIWENLHSQFKWKF